MAESKTAAQSSVLKRVPVNGSLLSASQFITSIHFPSKVGKGCQVCTPRCDLKASDCN